MNHRNADDLGGINSAVQSNRELLSEKHVIRRILDKDPTLWTKTGISESRARHCADWVDTFERTKVQLDQFQLASKRTSALIGMGGASLAAEVYSQVFSESTGCSLRVLSSTLPQSLEPYLGETALRNEPCIISSKSGGTVETLDIARSVIERARISSDQHLVITDPKPSILRDWAEEIGLRVLPSDPGVEGRYSALSAMGLIPAATLGVDVDRLFESYAEFKSALRIDGSKENQGVGRLASALAALCVLSGSTVALSVSERLIPLARWIEQLVAESLGKGGKGVLPVIDVARSDSVCKVTAEADGIGAATICSQSLADSYDLSCVFFEWEAAVAAAGFLCGINPFDQPDVEGNKIRISAALDAWSANRLEAAGESANTIQFSPGMRGSSVVELVQTLKSSIPASDYLSIMAFVAPTAENDLELRNFAQALAGTVSGATVYGFGPQYLHSTGQFHKGGPETGHYLILTQDARQDFEISGKPYRFAELARLQADTDSDALAARERPVYGIHLDEPAASRLQWLTEIIRDAGL